MIHRHFLALFFAWMFILSFASVSARSSPDVSTLVVEDDAPLPAECLWAGEDKIVCMGESTTIGCPVVTGNDNYCFRWFESKVKTSIGSNASIEVSPSQTTTYTLIVTNSDGNIVASDDVVISVLNRPDVQIISDQPVACDGLNINTTLSVNPAQENFIYQWHYAGWDEDDFLYTDEIVTSLSGSYSLTVTEKHSVVSCSQELSYELRDVNDSSSDSAIKDFFRANRFLEIGITVTEDLPGFSGNGLEGRSSLTTFIRDEADKLISIKSNNINLSLSLQALFGREQFEGLVTKGFITKNDNFCSSLPGGNVSLIQEIEAEFNASEAGIWIHIWENEDGEDSLFVKAQSPCQVDHSPVSTERAAVMLAFFNRVKEEVSFYSYPNKDEQLIDVLLDQVLDCYEGNVLDNSPPKK